MIIRKTYIHEYIYSIRSCVCVPIFQKIGRNLTNNHYPYNTIEVIP